MRARDYPYFSPRFIAAAHRGGSGLPANRGIENSARAFANAAALGYRYFETDVHATLDGTLVAFHDATLDRVTDGHGTIGHLPWAQVRRARIGGREPIPTLDELLETFPHARFNIDIKARAAIVPLWETILRHDAFDRVCVASFSGSRLSAFRRLSGTRVATAVGPLGVSWTAYGVGIRSIRAPRGQAYQIPERYLGERVPVLSRGLINAAHAAGQLVHVWTIDDPDDMARLIALGVDGLVSDRIDVLKDVLVTHGLWD